MLKPEAIVFANDHTLLLIDSEEPELFVTLAPDLVGWFERMGTERSSITRQPIGRFVLRSTLPAHSPGPHQSASLQGVLWTLQAAREAHRDIASYQAGIDRLSESSPRSGS